MLIAPTKLEGVHLLTTEPIFDERGYFARIWDREQLHAHGLAHEVAQVSLSRNEMIGTLRGLHWQAAPGLETKLVRVTRGRIFDVVVDLRADSPTFGRWLGTELAAGDGQALYVPPRCAHGFMTLETETEVLYQMSEPYDAALVRGLPWNDPDLDIEWPLAPRALSKADACRRERFADIVAESLLEAS